ncbi:uncharacterized protein LOC113332840 [Papaver somniferum]|uniref:uncharacterized protein LOC113332840 n=1 Tax=Papaver somniferum TaxID=3469 RepID=UPI000E6FFAE9|nr:uncharacterized protein LOC113332840 [Papaver somniferum]
MGSEKWEQKVMKFFMNPILRVPFYIFTLTLLSLLLPLSFLLLARLSYVKYPSLPSSFLLSLFLNINPALLQALLSFFSVTALIHGLTGKFTLLYGSPLQPRLHIAWIFLCVLQVTVGLGIEAIVVSGVWPEDYGADRRSLLISRIVFFIGLHETMLYWGKTVVRPVVDDTIFGGARGEKWIEKVAISAGFGALWLWRLRDEVETLVLVVEIKRELLIGLGISDFISWWLYYLTVTIGMLRVVKGLIWFAEGLFCRRRPQQSNNCPCDEDDSKV